MTGDLASTEGVLQDGVLQHALVQDGVVTGSVWTSGEFRFPLDIRFFEVDSLGVVFNMWYLGWCDEAMSAFMESIGYGYQTLRGQGFDAVLRKAELEWLDSLQAFQHAEVAVRVQHVGTTSFRLGYSIERVEASGQLRTRCAQAAITYVCVQIAGRSAAPIPEGMRQALVRDHADPV
ncbi:MAG: acyl-CoA thioesterase [Dermatophilaceae bacterium]|nr:acyl-CoA thioesterase [Dermatophilaceae bacterium]